MNATTPAAALNAAAVSIPQSGFGAFERWRAVDPGGPAGAFQSLSRDSGRLNPAPGPPSGHTHIVSIPQSGFGAFELAMPALGQGGPPQFQSLSRDSGRLNLGERPRPRFRIVVSIPQSGFGAFELRVAIPGIYRKL